jgi:hypothetical protein
MIGSPIPKHGSSQTILALRLSRLGISSNECAIGRKTLTAARGGNPIGTLHFATG